MLEIDSLQAACNYSRFKQFPPQLVGCNAVQKLWPFHQLSWKWTYGTKLSGMKKSQFYRGGRRKMLSKSQVAASSEMSGVGESRRALCRSSHRVTASFCPNFKVVCWEISYRMMWSFAGKIGRVCETRGLAGKIRESLSEFRSTSTFPVRVLKSREQEEKGGKFDSRKKYYSCKIQSLWKKWMCFLWLSPSDYMAPKWL